jgi:hypothetical protein
VITTSQTVNNLLGGCPAAGFAESLYVDAMATDGISPDLGYDAADIFAFALAPEGILP